MARKYNYGVSDNTRRCPHCSFLIAAFSYDEHFFFCRREHVAMRIEVVNPVEAARLEAARQKDRAYRQKRKQEKEALDIIEGERLMESVLAAFTRQEITEYPEEPSGEDDL
jgi:hypothetical protein